MSCIRSSVIITSFNQREFVGQAIESSLNQSAPDVEVIVIDDGSTDGTQEFVKRYFGRHIVFVAQENQGPSVATNSGLNLAKGDFLVLLGGDDVCDRNRVEEQISYLEENSLDIGFCIPKLIDGNGNLLDESKFPYFTRAFTSKDLLRTLLTEGNFLCAPTAMLRRSVVGHVGLFSRGLIQLQDFEYWLRCAFLGLKIGRAPSSWVNYRRHANNLSSEARVFSSNVEEAYIIDRLLEQEPYHKALRAIFGNMLPPTADPFSPLTELDKLLISLGHPNPQLRSLGAIRAISRIDDSNFKKALDDMGIVFPKLLYNSLS